MQVSILALLFILFTPRVFFRLPVSNRWLLAAHAVSFFLVSYIVFTMMKYTSRMGFQNNESTSETHDYLPYNFGTKPKNSNMSSLLLVDFDEEHNTEPTHHAEPTEQANGGFDIQQLFSQTENQEPTQPSQPSE